MVENKKFPDHCESVDQRLQLIDVLAQLFTQRCLRLQPNLALKCTYNVAT